MSGSSQVCRHQYHLTARAVGSPVRPLTSYGRARPAFVETTLAAMLAATLVPTLAMLLLFIAAAPVLADSSRIPGAPVLAVAPVAAPEQSRVIEFAEARLASSAGVLDISASTGWDCGRSAPVNAPFRRILEEQRELLGLQFTKELVKLGFQTSVQRSDKIFDQSQRRRPELLVGAVIHSLAADFCYPDGPSEGAPLTGAAFVEVHWEVFDVASKRVVAEAVTQGSHRINAAAARAEFILLAEAFGHASRSLLANEQVRGVLTGRRQGTGQVTLKPLRIPSAKPFRGKLDRNMDRVLASVVVVEVDGGHGSGFLISSKGYVLTNAHVVGTASKVQVKLSTGLRVQGKVIRKSIAADVALIALGGDALPSLPFLSDPPGVGREVYAVGAPLSTELSATVSRGIVSGYRDVDGRKLLQSDVNVLPGNSGGPLLDHHGNVVAMTSFGILAEGKVGLGLNFFVPIDEAMRSIGINTSRPVTADAVVAPARPPRTVASAASPAKPASKPAVLRVALLEPSFVRGDSWGVNPEPLENVENRLRQTMEKHAGMTLVVDHRELRRDGYPQPAGQFWNDNFIERRPILREVQRAGRALKVDVVLMMVMYVDHYDAQSHRIVAFWLDVASGTLKEVEGQSAEPREMVRRVVAVRNQKG